MLLVQPDGRVRAQLSCQQKTLGTPSRGDDTRGAGDLRRLDRCEPDGTGSPQHEDSVLFAGLRPPHNGEPAREPGRAACASELVGDRIRKGRRNSFGHDSPLGQRAVTGTPEPVARDIDARARLQGPRLEHAGNGFRARSVRSGRRAAVEASACGRDVDRIERHGDRREQCLAVLPFGLVDLLEHGNAAELMDACCAHLRGGAGGPPCRRRRSRAGR